MRPKVWVPASNFFSRVLLISLFALAAVHHLGRHLASALGHARITVNNLAPGLVPSKMSNQLKVYSSDDAMISGIPLGRKVCQNALLYCNVSPFWCLRESLKIWPEFAFSGPAMLALGRRAPRFPLTEVVLLRDRA